MHKILSVFVFMFLVSFCANATNSVTCTLNNNNDGCVSYNGCEYSEPNAMANTPAKCTKCRPQFFNATTNNSSQCSQCSASYFTNTMYDGKEWDPDDISEGNIECPWKCASGWFIDHNGNSCIACPNSNSGIVNYSNNDDEHIGVCTCNGGNTYLIQTTINSSHSYYCGQCGAGVQPSTSYGVATCTCPAGSNNVHGELVSGTRLECRCPTNDGYWDSSTQQCACHNNKILTQLSSGEWVCSSCDATKHETFNNGECVCQQGYYRPTDSTAACTKCPDFASTDDVNSHSINDCHCRSDYGQYPADSSTVPGDFVCNKCDDNATVDSSSVQCKCDENYYGNGLQNSCVKCPAGTTKSAGGSVNQPSTQSACHFTSGATKFCIPSTVRTVDNSGYVCFTPTNVTYLY